MKAKWKALDIKRGLKRSFQEDEVASKPPTISFSNIFSFGGGVWGGAALKGKGNGGGMHARSEYGARPEAQSNSNAYVEVQSHHALRALQSLSFLEMGSSKGQYFCTQ